MGKKARRIITKDPDIADQIERERLMRMSAMLEEIRSKNNDITVESQTKSTGFGPK